MTTTVDAAPPSDTEGRPARRSILTILRTPRPALDTPKWLNRAVAVALLIALVALPLNSPQYVNFDISMVLMYAVVGFGLNLLTGYCGQISLGHSAFFAAGAYVSAVLIQSDVHYLIGIPAAAVSCFVLGYLIGLPALRLQGLQLALVTLALALITPAVIKRFDEITKGQEGINLSTAKAPAWSGLATDQWIYYLCLVVAVVAFVVTRRLTSGKIGRSLIAVRDHEAVASTLGIRTSRTKTIVFALSAAYAGIGGVLYTYVVQFVAPEAFGLQLAIAFLSLIVVGGLGTVSGAIIGAVFIHYVPELTAGINQAAAGVTYGGVLIACMFLAPFGVIGLVRIVFGRTATRLPRHLRRRAPAPTN